MTRNFVVLPAGEYPFRVLDAQEKKSKAGNDMIELKLAIGEDAANEAIVFDWLVFDGKGDWKINNFLKTCGYHQGEGIEQDIVADEFIGWEGTVKVKVEQFDGTDRNKVAAYTWTENQPF